MLRPYKYILLTLLQIALLYGCRQKSGKEHTHEKQLYTCAMHPEIIRDSPGTCPICGMTLVKKEGVEMAKAETTINTLLLPSNEFVVSSVPVTTLQKERQSIEVDALGSISYDTRKVGTISARYAGRIEKLYVRYRFQKVTRGQKIMDIYSPELMTAQQNLLFLLTNDKENTAIINAAKQRLVLLGMTSSQISQIMKTSKPLFAVSIYSEYTGHIHEAATATSMAASSQRTMRDVSITTEELSLRPGMYIQKGQSLFSIYDPAKAWASLSIYADMHMVVQRGDAVVIVPETAPSLRFRGKINDIEPFFRAGSKTLTARVYFDNSKLQIPIGSQVSATIFSAFHDAAWLPATAVVSLGTDKVVFIRQHQGFIAHRLVTGLVYKDKIQVVSGLTTKDTVAQNAQFLTDSERFIKINK